MKITHKILTLTQVQDRVLFSATHIWRMERAGKFPHRVKLGPNRVGWLETEINTWLESKLKERENG